MQTKQPTQKLTLSIFIFMAITLLALAALALSPTVALAGITPTPTPLPTETPTPAPPSPPDTGGGGSDSHYLEVQFGCNLACAAEIAVEVQAPVKIVHQETGWIAEGMVSNGSSTKIEVPYAGKWDVYLNGDVIVSEGLLIEGAAGDKIATIDADTLFVLDCPAACSSAFPPNLPVTGGETQNPAVLPLLLAVLLIFGAVGMSLKEKSRV